MSRPLALLVACCLGAAPAAAQTHLVVITGLSGEARYRESFRAWAGALLDAARTRYAVPDGRIIYLAESPAAAAGPVAGRSTKEMIEQVLADLAGRAEPEAQIVIVVFGHGSAATGEPRIHLPGPDMTAADFARLLGAFRTQRVAFVNAASASGDWIPVLSGERRVIVTATRSGHERLDTRFGHYFVEALADDGADTDKDGRVSLLEAFEYARRSVAALYERSDRLRTEHALLDDDGDGTGSEQPDPSAGDGGLARRMFLDTGRAAAGEAGDPALAPLYARRDSLEQAVSELRARKATLEPAAYERELERLLLQLAHTTRAIREREERRP